MNARTQTNRSGFTLIEVLVVITIIVILIALLLVSLAGARRSAGSAAERQSVVALKMGVEQFKNEHGFLPPMVKDVAHCKYSYDGWSAIYTGEQDPIRKVGTVNDLASKWGITRQRLHQIVDEIEDAEKASSPSTTGGTPRHRPGGANSSVPGADKEAS